jgi:hypothetical protein
MRFKGVSCQLARTAVASLALLIAAEDLAAAGSSRNERSIESVATGADGERIMAIVSLLVSGSPLRRGWLDLAGGRLVVRDKPASSITERRRASLEPVR